MEITRPVSSFPIVKLQILSRQTGPTAVLLAKLNIATGEPKRE